MPKANEVYYREGYRTPENLTEVFSGRWQFPDESVFQHAWRDKMGALYRDAGVASGQNAVDAASMVFAHSILDYCVNECCRISAMARLEDWETDVGGRKISVAEIKGGDYLAVLRQMVDAYVEELLRRTSLVKRIDLLNQKCQPIPPFTHFELPYTYDRDRIGRIDLSRQEIVHRTAFNIALDSIDDDLNYLEATTAYAMRLVNYKYRLEIDFEFWMKKSQQRAAEKE